MAQAFRAYEPTTARSSLKACSACYARKVRCEAGASNEKCAQCSSSGAECRPRTRKRRATATDSQPNGTLSTSTFTVPPPEQVDSQTQEARHRPYADDGSLAVDCRSAVSTGGLQPPLLFVQRTAPSGQSPESSATDASKRQRTSSFLSRSAILGNEFEGIDHSHGERATDFRGLSPVELEALRAQGVFELPDLPIRQSLLEVFVEKCYPWMPVLELPKFESAYLSGEGSVSLFQAVTLAASIMRPELYSKSVVDTHYKRLKALIQSGHERDHLNSLAALCLIQWYTTAAPGEDVTTDSPRFWNTYAIGLAHQVGLHRANSCPAEKKGLRRRIWFTLCARDCLTSSAHGRPRIICDADSDLPPACEQDFAAPGRRTASLFQAYVEATTILGDLCQNIMRHGRITAADREATIGRLTAWSRKLPNELRLLCKSRQYLPYSFNVAQLHLPVLVSIIILYRPSPIFAITASNAASVTAAFLSFRIFQSIHLRGETKCLGSAFAWYLLVAAIPLIAAAQTSSLRQECSDALGSLETYLDTLGQVRPAAAINLKSVVAIRRAASSTARPRPDRLRPQHDVETEMSPPVRGLLDDYGAHAFAVRVATMLPSPDSHAERAPGEQADNGGNEYDQWLTPGRHEQGSTQPVQLNSDIQDAFSQLFEEDLFDTDSSWMMRDWLNDMPGLS